MATWKKLGAFEGSTLTDLWGAPGGTLFVSTSSGGLFRSDDAGGHWDALETGYVGSLVAVAGNGDSDVFVLGSEFRTRGRADKSWNKTSTLLHAKDGRSFKRLPIGRRTWLANLSLWGDEVYLSGPHGMLRSTDHGRSFDVVEEGHGASARLLCVGPGHVLRVHEGAIAVSVDGGDRWRASRLPLGASATRVYGSLGYGLYAMGPRHVLISTDEAMTWKTLHALGAEADSDHAFLDLLVWGPRDVFVVTRKAVLRSIDGAPFARATANDSRAFGLRAAGTRLFLLTEAGLYGMELGPRPEATPTPATAKKPASAPSKRDQESAARLREQLEAAGPEPTLALKLTGITSLAALAEAPWLEDLQLYASAKPVQLSTLPILPALKTLRLNALVDSFGPLKQQPALTSLELNLPQASLEGLELLPQLTELGVHELSRPTSLEPLGRCPALATLSLSGKVPSLRPLLACKTLRSLTLENAQDPILPKLPLTALQLRKAKDLSRLEDLSTLEALSAEGGFDDLSPLEALTSLRTLALQSKALTDLSPLAKLTRLRALSLDGCPRVSDLRSLARITQLESLNLSHTAVKDLGPLKQLASLTALHLNETKVTDLSVLRAFPNLEVLAIEGLGKVKHADALATLTKLHTLHAEGTVVDAKHLANLPALGLAKQGDVADDGAAALALGPGAVIASGVVRVALAGCAVRDLALSPDGTQLAVVLRPEKPEAGAPLRRFSTRDGSLLEASGDPRRRYTGAAFSVDGTRLYYAVTDASDRNLELWSVPVQGRGEPTKHGKIPDEFEGKLHAMCDGNTLIVAGGKLVFWDLAKAKVTRSFKTEHGASAAPCHHAMAAWVGGTGGHGVHRYDCATGELTRSVPAERYALLTIDHEERYLIAVADGSYGVFVFDLRTGEPVLPGKFYADAHLNPAAVSPDGTLLIELGPTLTSYRLPEARRRAEGPEGLNASALVAIDTSRDGRFIAYAVTSYGDGDEVCVLPLRTQ